MGRGGGSGHLCGEIGGRFKIRGDTCVGWRGNVLSQRGISFFSSVVGVSL